jgi:hypothetical protein
MISSFIAMAIICVLLSSIVRDLPLDLREQDGIRHFCAAWAFFCLGMALIYTNF